MVLRTSRFGTVQKLAICFCQGRSKSRPQRRSKNRPEELVGDKGLSGRRASGAEACAA